MIQLPAPAAPLRARTCCSNAEATSRLARHLSHLLRGGDVLLLSGPLGSGKTHFARSLIQARQAAIGPDQVEDVPSPTFTLVQTYQVGELEIWHADLYRLCATDELCELGLDSAFGTALCLVEWPDRLVGQIPPNAAWLVFETGPPADADRRWISLFAPDDLPWLASAQSVMGAA